MKPLFIALGLLLLVTGAARADFKAALAARLMVNADYLVLNVPPRPDTWPGAIFTWNMRIPIKHGDEHDPALRRGTPIAISGTEVFEVSAGAKMWYANFFGLSASAADLANASMFLPDATVVDMELGELIRHVQASEDAISAAKRGQAPVLVIKSYEATPVIKFAKKAGVSAEAWAKVTKEVQGSVQGQAASVNEIVYTASRPIVIAFETQQVEFNLKDLSDGNVTLTLASLPTSLFAFREAETDKVSAEINNALAANLGISPGTSPSAFSGINLHDLFANGSKGSLAANMREIRKDIMQ